MCFREKAFQLAIDFSHSMSIRPNKVVLVYNLHCKLIQIYDVHEYA